MLLSDPFEEEADKPKKRRIRDDKEESVPTMPSHQLHDSKKVVHPGKKATQMISSIISRRRFNLEVIISFKATSVRMPSI